MPIWNQECSTSDHVEINQTYVHHLSALWDDLQPALCAPCDAYGDVLNGLLGPVVKRLESQATSHGRRVRAVAAQLDALGVPEGVPPVDDGSASPPLIALETSGGDTGPIAALAVQEGADDGGVTPTRYTPVEPDHVFGWSFAEARPAWHARAVAWAGDMLPDLAGYDSFASFLAVRQDGGAPDAPDPTHPDIP